MQKSLKIHQLNIIKIIKKDYKVQKLLQKFLNDIKVFPKQEKKKNGNILVNDTMTCKSILMENKSKLNMSAAWKVSKYRVYSCIWTEYGDLRSKYFSCIQSEHRKLRTIKNSLSGHFSCSAGYFEKSFLEQKIYFRKLIETKICLKKLI